MRPFPTLFPLFLATVCLTVARADFASYFGDPTPLGGGFYQASQIGVLYEDGTFPWVYANNLDTWIYCAGTGAAGGNFQLYSAAFSWFYLDAPSSWLYAYDQDTWWYSFGLARNDSHLANLYYNSAFDIIQPFIAQAPQPTERVNYHLGDFNEVDGGPITLIPLTEVFSTVYILAFNLAVDGIVVQALVDTGSVYAFIETHQPELGYNGLQRYTYGSGMALYRPGSTDGPAFMKPDTSFLTPLAGPLTVGRGTLTLINQSIVGLSGNLEQKNHEGMTSVIQQIKPRHLSFAFPQGLLGGGYLRFAPLPNPGAVVVELPLISPGKLGYGYTSDLEKLVYYTEDDNDTPHTTIEQTPDGVRFSNAGGDRIVADRFVAFFDTGTTVPSNLFNGDYSLLSDQTTNSLIEPPADATVYSRLEITFRDTQGERVTISRDYSHFAKNLPDFVPIPTPDLLPAGLETLINVVGLNFLGHYDFQIDFSEPGVATTLTLFVQATTD